MPKNQDVFTVAEAAQYLRCSKQAVLKLTRSGRLTAAYIASKFLIHRRALEDLLLSDQRERPSQKPKSQTRPEQSGPSQAAKFRRTKANSPFGWGPDPEDPTRLIEVATEQAVIGQIMFSHRSGKVPGQIAKGLAAKGIQRRGRKVWYTATVRNIIQRQEAAQSRRDRKE